jgi:dsRNA-specific ribonuclease
MYRPPYNNQPRYQQAAYRPVPPQKQIFQGVYLGKRDDSFKRLIASMLETGDISKKYIEQLLSPEGMSYFSTAFTHESADRENNYEFLETLGDATLDTCVVWYLAQRFPQIRCKAGSDIFTKLKITLVQSKNLAKLATELGFWDFISMAKNLNENPQDEKVKILEDVFEACLAAVQLLLDGKYGIGVGHVTCYKIISKLLDKKNIRIVYEELVDAKTRLKELFDKPYNKQRYGEFAYVDRSIRGDDDSIIYHKIDIVFAPTQIISPYKNTKAYLKPGSNLSQLTVIAEGQQYNTQTDAEQNAAQLALDYLKKTYGLSKEVPPEYTRFCT